MSFFLLKDLPVLPALDHVGELVELSLEGRRDDALLGERDGRRGGAAPLLADGHRSLLLRLKITCTRVPLLLLARRQDSSSCLIKLKQL